MKKKVKKYSKMHGKKPLHVNFGVVMSCTCTAQTSVQ